MQKGKHFSSICLALAVLALAVFAPIAHHDFINYDDPDYVTENSIVQRGLTVDGIVWAFQTGHMGNWHPVTWISHMLDCQFFGTSPKGHPLRLKTDWPAALNFLARILATSSEPKFRDGEEAAKLAEHACKLANFQNVAYLDTLGAAFAQKGDFAAAIDVAQKAKELAIGSGQNAVGEQIKLHIRQYESGQPLREF